MQLDQRKNHHMWSFVARLSVLVVDIVDVAGTVPVAIGPSPFDLDIVEKPGPGIVVESLADTGWEVRDTVFVVGNAVVGTVVVPGSHSSVDSRIVRTPMLAEDAELHAGAGDVLSSPDRTPCHW